MIARLHRTEMIEVYPAENRRRRFGANGLTHDLSLFDSRFD